MMQKRKIQMMNDNAVGDSIFKFIMLNFFFVYLFTQKGPIDSILAFIVIINAYAFILGVVNYED